MAKLQKFQAKICYTAAGVLVHDGKVLLVKHKKLRFWLNPGGHLEENELPHVAAEREYWEETGIKVRAVDSVPRLESGDGEYVPNPFATNLHWVSQENYQQRLKNGDPTQRVKTKIWSRGCEQHLNFVYLVEPIGSTQFTQNVEETQGIKWFTLEEALQLKMPEDIKSEIRFAFEARKMI